jgi:subtilisin
VKRILFLLLIVGGLGLWSWGATAESSAPVRVIVTFHERPSASQEMRVSSLGGIVRYRYDLLPAIAVELPRGALASLRAAPGVAMVEEDQPVRLLDTELDNSWGVKHIGAGDVHPFNSGDGIKVAILDTGIDYGHPDLNGNYAGGYDFVNDDADPFDDHYHGTLVAGVVAAEDNSSGVIGVAPAARLYALKVLDQDGSGWSSDIIAALDWAVSNDIDVVNMSFGSPYDSSSFHTAIANAYNAGLVLVAAAGNEDTCPPVGDTVQYPAKYDEVIAVAATDQSDNRACFSSTGSAVELAAPGVSVRTTYPGGSYAWASGTSLASPHVVGAAALVLASGISDANGNGRVNDEARLWLQETAADLGTAGRDTLYGFGLVDVRSLASGGTDDSDGDGYTDAVETFMGTDPLDSCPDSRYDDAWPPDVNNDGKVNIQDPLRYKYKLAPNNPYDRRYDLNTDGTVNIQDVSLYKYLIGSTCG